MTGHIPDPPERPATNPRSLPPNQMIDDYLYVRACIFTHRRDDDVWPVAFDPDDDGIVV